MDKKVEEIHGQLIAFYPVYASDGNMTRLIFNSDGQKLVSNSTDPRQVESVKRALARCYAVDLSAQASLLRDKYHRRILLHFYLTDGRVFVPFKLRESRISGDACYGYIDLDQVARLVPGNDSYVKLKSGNRLPLYSNITTARLAYFMGLEILSDCVDPNEDADLDLVNALAVLRKVFASEPQPGREPARRFRVKFLPTK
ncbi:MAG: hypothetical protein CVU90_13825 [Firmicutes bacterium HGW-Firmicutes-15]|nr:MAG: hypothetical protein CVU90_13825 [Firmicutes bacterium HGW-Firmicutes-15]